MIKIALLGCGRIGQVHARAIKNTPDASVVAVADALPAAAEALAAASGADVRSVPQIMQSADVDAIVIGTPTTTHYDLIHQAAAAAISREGLEPVAEQEHQVITAGPDGGGSTEIPGLLESGPEALKAIVGDRTGRAHTAQEENGDASSHTQPAHPTSHGSQPSNGRAVAG